MQDISIDMNSVSVFKSSKFLEWLPIAQKCVRVLSDYNQDHHPVVKEFVKRTLKLSPDGIPTAVDYINQIAGKTVLLGKSDIGDIYEVRLHTNNLNKIGTLVCRGKYD